MAKKLAILNHFPQIKLKTLPRRDVQMQTYKSMGWSFFDGVLADHPRHGGVEGTLFLYESDLFKIEANIGPTTNNMA